MTETTPETPKSKRAIEDRQGFGFLGLTGGIVGGFVASYYLVVPNVGKDITVMTVATMAVMIVAAGVGYFFTRRSAPRKKKAADSS